jgi:hypothetical protein
MGTKPRILQSLEEQRRDWQDRNSLACEQQQQPRPILQPLEELSRHDWENERQGHEGDRDEHEGAGAAFGEARERMAATAREAARVSKSQVADSLGLAQRGHDLGLLLQKKNAAYGDSFSKSGEFLKLLYPEGVKPEQYAEMLVLVRIFDKQMRIATDRDALGENPFQDIAGYGILGSTL